MKPAAKLASGVACTGVATTGTKERSTGFGHIADASPAEAHLVRSQVPQPTPARAESASEGRSQKDMPKKASRTRIRHHPKSKRNQNLIGYNFPLFNGYKSPFSIRRSPTLKIY
jgi:hypothetical protein